MNDSLKEKILKLKKEKDALILAHYYQRAEIQDIADAVGDSYYLSKVAKDCSNNIIVFCGVKFMAESAKILSPEKTVLLPAFDAGCPMADMANVKDILRLKHKHPTAKIVCYINSSTEVKAISDVCCTSSNAINIINNLDAEEIIFIPDKNLGEYVQEKIKNKKIILWHGFCITHKKVNVGQVSAIKELHPDIQILVHPECEKPVRELADFIGSTGEIIKFANKSYSEKFLICTEEGVLHQLKKENPTKKFYVPSGGMSCINMKKTYLENVYESLLNIQYEIELDISIRERAYKSLIHMHELGGK